MVDALILLSPTITPKFRRLVEEKGFPTRGYAKRLDLYKSALARLPVRLFYKGWQSGIHKLEIHQPARLGLPRLKNIVAKFFPDPEKIKIYRIDVCVDLLGWGAWELAQNCRIPRIQNTKIFRERGAISVYLQSASNKTIVFYDKKREMEAKGSPWAKMLRPEDRLTRVEVRLKGAGVPYREFGNIKRYLHFDFLEGLRFRRLLVTTDKTKPIQSLATAQLRHLIERNGLQMTSKMFSAAAWARIDKDFFREMNMRKQPDLSLLIQRRISDWMKGRIRYPRCKRELND